MKSDVMVIGTNQEFTEKALDFTEQYAGNLPPKAHLRLRLVAEEIMNLFRSVTGEAEAEYWIENNSNIFTLHLDTKTIMHAQKRQELLDLSTTKENEAAKGFMGQILEAIELASIPYGERDALIKRYKKYGYLKQDIDKYSTDDLWKMSEYKSAVSECEDPEFAKIYKDQLEKSILANLANEVTISIRGDKVSMAVEFDGHIKE